MHGRHDAPPSERPFAAARMRVPWAGMALVSGLGGELAKANVS